MILEGMITVLVPVYNAAESIVSCMESITVQTYKELEILCIDAGSTDGTVELLGKISEIDSRIRVIHSEKKSYGYQVNLGISEARGEYIGIVEADDVILQDMYERLYSVAKKADADMVRAPYYETSLGKEGEACRRLVHIAPDETVYERNIDTSDEPDVLIPDAIATWSGIYKTEFLLQNEIWYNETPGASFQDFGFWAQTHFYAKKVYYHPEPFYCYRIDNPASSTFQMSKMFCLCDEMSYISERFGNTDWKEKTRLLERICWITYRKYKRNLERVPEECRTEFYKRFSGDFRVWREKFGIMYTDFYEEEKVELEAIMNDPLKYLQQMSDLANTFLEELEKQDSLILYGAGRMGLKLAERLEGKVVAFATSGAPAASELVGIPVRDINEIVCESNNIPIVIASKRSDYRESMKTTACKLGYNKIVLLPYGAFEW